MAQVGVLLINLGTPASPSTGDVRRYLREFLDDDRVIDIPYLLRKILVHGIIAPFRAPKSAKLYKEVWTDKGSPIMLHSLDLQVKVQEALGADYEVELAMRYEQPSIKNVLARMQKKHYNKIIIVPLYPHYASSSTGTAFEEVMKHMSKWWVIPDVKFIGQYFDNPQYIDAIVENGSKFNIADYDHVMFSYHGLPKRHVNKVYEDRECDNHNCEDEINHENEYCYKAACYATTRAIVAKMNIPKDKYTVSFQSRLDEKWITPFSDNVLEEFAKKGMKRILAFSPAFTADCLETLIEIGVEYQEIFIHNGGEKIQLVPSLNSNATWVNCLRDMVIKNNV